MNKQYKNWKNRGKNLKMLIWNLLAIMRSLLYSSKLLARNCISLLMQENVGCGLGG